MPCCVSQCVHWSSRQGWAASALLPVPSPLCWMLQPSSPCPPTDTDWSTAHHTATGQVSKHLELFNLKPQPPTKRAVSITLISELIDWSGEAKNSTKTETQVPVVEIQYKPPPPASIRTCDLKRPACNRDLLERRLLLKHYQLAILDFLSTQLLLFQTQYRTHL